jgi:predicted RNA methylase
MQSRRARAQAQIRYRQHGARGITSRAEEVNAPLKASRILLCVVLRDDTRNDEVLDLGSTCSIETKSVSMT